MEVSAEVHFAQTLASNEKKFRDRALKRLRKYISVRSCHGEGLSHEDYIKIWKGLHYCMWMQDKPLIQEELSQKMTDLLHAFPKLQDALNFVNVFFITEAREWSGIDRFRLDKFMMLIRDILHETFVLLSQEGWPLSECQIFSQNLTAAVMNEDNTKIPFGLKTHLADIYLTELRKVPLKGINGLKLTMLMFPFVYFLLKTKRHELGQTVFKRTLHPILLEFGNWSWYSGKMRKGKGEAGKTSKSKKSDWIDDEVMDDSADESGDEQEVLSKIGYDETSDIEVDDNKNSTKFDLSPLLKLMQRLAEDPKVDSRNRTYVYGIVKSYTTRDPSILQIPDAKDDGVVAISSVFQLTGETEDESDKKKNRRRKRRGEDLDKEPVADVVEKSVQKGKLNQNKTKSASSHHDQSDKKNKGKKNDMNFKQDKDDKETQIIRETSSIPAKVKKRKRVSIDGESHAGVVDFKKMKIEGDYSNNLKHIELKKTSSPVNDNETSIAVKSSTKKYKNKTAFQEEMNHSNYINSKNDNTNTNALSQPAQKTKKKSNSLVSPIQCVVYPQKSPAKPMSVNQLTKSITTATTKFTVSDSSPTRSKVNDPKEASVSGVAHLDNSTVSIDGDKEPSCQSPSSIRKSSKKKKSNSISLTTTPPSNNVTETETMGDVKKSSVGVIGSLYGTVVTPCHMIKKAVGMVVPATDSGTPGNKIAATPETCDTPGSQKKVVFDLRKNKANKFQDYLKTLANDPSPAFEPGKSPSQSILKSPSTESLLSQGSSSASSTPVTRKKKGKRGSASKKSSPMLKGIY